MKLNQVKKLSAGLALFATVSTNIYGADSLPVGSVEAKSTARVGSAELLSPGRFGLGLSMHSASGVLKSHAVDADGGMKDIVAKSSQTRAALSYGVSDWMEISLGLGMTNESGEVQSYRSLLGDESDTDEKSIKASGFAGASLAAKLGLIRDGIFRMSLMPFVETGSGQAGEYSMTRSESAKLGWMLMTNIGSKNLAELDLNVGYRYRNAERIGESRLRNEMIYQGLVRGYFNSNFGVFGGGQGRLISVARDSGKDENGKTQYRPIESGELVAGLSVNIDDFRFEAYAGQSTGEYGIGHGNAMMGAGLSMNIGSKRRASLADEVQVPAAKPVANIKTDNDDHLVKPAKLDPLTDKDMDLFGDVDKILANETDSGAGEHDFKTLPQKSPEQIKSATPGAGAELDRVERELEEIRAREEKIKEADAKRIAAEEEVQRLERKKIYQEQLKLEDSYRQEMRDRIEVFPAVTDEDYGWSGLDE
jgi:hypothetical protein